MVSFELDDYVLNDGIRELDVQIGQLKSWIKEKRWGEVDVRIGDLTKLLSGIRRHITRIKKG